MCCRYPQEPQRPSNNDQVVVAPTTQRPVVTQPPRYIPPQTQRPVAPPTPYRGNEYIPPYADVPTNVNPNYLPPSDEITGGSEEKPDVIRPQQPTPPPQLPPIQCPAATNCTEVEFCGADGTISKTPVILTKDQETFRVPLSDCRDIKKGITGKCCRDPDYTDPWPTSILGQYNATILGFDDGTYKPTNNDLAGVPKGPNRGSGQLSLPIPGASQQTLTRTPFLQGVKSQYSKSTNNPEQNSISQREKPDTYKYQHNQFTPSQQNNFQPSPQQYYQPQNPQPSQPRQQPGLFHETQQQPQQPIVHNHVLRQSAPTAPSYQPYQPQQQQQQQPIIVQEPVSQRQNPFGAQYTNPSNGQCATRDTVSYRLAKGNL